MSSTKFRNIVWKYWRENGRHDLPWRKTRDPYKILVSEVMLQQTQVERVKPFYENFLQKFPNVKALAKAPLAEVLKNWQGLGYNRRAKMLHAAAKEVVAKYGGKFPKNAEELEKLPGIGHYTANAVAAFAFNQDAVFIETNIRTAILHDFFPKKKSVSDAQIRAVLENLLPRGKSREWNLALMDYGAHLKRSGIKLNAKSKHYAKQSKFAGSNREARGAILKELSRSAAAAPRLAGLLGDDRALQLKSALAALQKEGLIQKRGRVFTLPR